MFLDCFGGRFLFLSIAVHFLFGLFATWYVVQRIEAKPKLSFQAGGQGAKATNRVTEHKVQLAKKNTLSATAQSKRITTTAVSARVALPSIPMPMDNMASPARMGGADGAGVSFAAAPMGLGPGGGTAGGIAIPFFGFRSNKGVGVGLEGWFYDLKTDHAGKKIPIGNNYYEKIAAFLDDDWNPRVFKSYFKSKTALYTPQIYVPVSLSEMAGKCFGQDKVEANFWVVHYKGSCMAPKAGTFRFVGLGDNVLVVRLNKHIVIDYRASLPPGVAPAGGQAAAGGLASANNSASDLGPAGPNWPMVGGKWFDVREGDLLEIEVLIGDSGGFFSAYLFIEEKGAHYAKRKDAPKFFAYPVFQLAPAPIPKSGPAGPNLLGSNPEYAKTAVVFPPGSFFHKPILVPGAQ
ncbi:MAG: hypothetical protein WCH43_00405 [Verrucomicrobiota bacterium]